MEECRDEFEDEVTPFCCSSNGHVGWVPICEPCVDKQDFQSTKHSIIATSAVLGLFLFPLSMKVMGKSWFGGGAFGRTIRSAPPAAPPEPPPPPEPTREPKSLLKYFIIGFLVAFRTYQYHFKAAGSAINRLP